MGRLVFLTSRDPSIEHDQPTNVGHIGQPLQLPGFAAPGFPLFGTRYECGPRFCHAAVGKWDLVHVGHFDHTEVECPQAEPSGQMCCDPLARQRMLELFSPYLSSEIADAIWEQRDELIEGDRLKPQEATVTVLMTDLEGFTNIAEKLDARRIGIRFRSDAFLSPYKAAQ